MIMQPKRKSLLSQVIKLDLVSGRETVNSIKMLTEFRPMAE